MTVLFFARRFYPLIGGVEKHVLEISRRLVKKGYKVVVVTEVEKNTNGVNYHSLPSSDMIEGIHIVRINTGSEGRLKKFRIWKELLNHVGIIKSADIVHCHDIFFWYLPYRFIFPFKKVYTTFHGYEGNDLPTKKAIMMHKISEKLSNGNICVGDYIAKWYGTKPTIVTYGAIDEDLVKKYKNNEKGNGIIFIGRLEKETGIFEYLKTLEALRDKGLSLSMDAYGEGSMKNIIKDYAVSKKLNISLKGVISSTESVIDNYKYVFCSRYLGVLEAMSFKKIIFVNYNNDIKRDCFSLSPFKDFIVLESDPTKMAEKFIKYKDNDKLSKDMIEKGYEWVIKQTWGKMTDNYLALWGIKS